MRWVPHAAIAPHRCAVVPFIGNSNAKRGFVDTGTDLVGWDPHVYVSYEGFAEMGKLFGWRPSASRDEVTVAHARVTELEEENAELRAENYALLEFKNAVDVMASADFIARRKPGRPKQEVA